MASANIPVCAPVIGANEVAYVTEAVRSTWISSAGSFLDRVNREVPAWLGAKYGRMVTSGTSALHLCALALGLKPGDEVIVPTFTMVSSAFAMAYTGARPVFVDCDAETWTIDLGRIEEKLTPRTRAIMGVHLYGHPCQMTRLRALARAHDLKVIEDAAEGVGSEVDGRRCGSLGDIGAVSFYANKLITSGEGGMVLTDDPELHQRAGYFGNLCYPVGQRGAFTHDEIGFNYRATNVQAALLAAQFEQIGTLLARKREIARRYLERLAGVPGLRLPVERPWARNSYWMFGVVLEPGLERAAVMQRLKEQGIETRAFFTPMHQQKSLRPFVDPERERFPVADDIAVRGLYLPSGAGLTNEDIDYVCEQLRRAAR
jgi:perosamine synthetase